MTACPLGRLARDVTLVLDSGAPRRGEQNEFRGAAHVAAELQRLQSGRPGAVFRAVEVNGAPGWTLISDRRVVGVVSAEMRGGAIARLWVVVNPDKLRHWNAQRGQD